MALIKDVSAVQHKPDWEKALDRLTGGGIPKKQYAAFVNCKKGFSPDNDYYIFTRVTRDLTKVYLVGWIATAVLLDTAEFVNRGDADDSGFIFKSSGYHIPISDLKIMGDFRSSC